MEANIPLRNISLPFGRNWSKHIEATIVDMINSVHHKYHSYSLSSKTNTSKRLLLAVQFYPWSLLHSWHRHITISAQQLLSTALTNAICQLMKNSTAAANWVNVLQDPTAQLQIIINKANTCYKIIQTCRNWGYWENPEDSPNPMYTNWEKLCLRHQYNHWSVMSVVELVDNVCIYPVLWEKWSSAMRSKNKNKNVCVHF